MNVTSTVGHGSKKQQNCCTRLFGANILQFSSTKKSLSVVLVVHCNNVINVTSIWGPEFRANIMYETNNL